MNFKSQGLDLIDFLIGTSSCLRKYEQTIYAVSNLIHGLDSFCSLWSAWRLRLKVTLLSLVIIYGLILSDFKIKPSNSSITLNLEVTEY